jgi:outer membrane protein TolC
MCRARICHENGHKIKNMLVPGCMHLNYFGLRLKHLFFTFIVALTSSSYAQTANDNAPYLTLDQCIVYALQKQPALMQSLINISIVQKTNAINISAWLPQVNFNINFMHYNQLPTTFSLNSLDPTGPPLKGHPGVINAITPQIVVTQTIFSPDVLNAAKSAHIYVQQARQSSDSVKISLVTNVSKAFYSLLLTLEQMDVLKEDTTRLGKNLRDTYRQYVGGIVDKTDYKEAAITLNNSKAQLNQARENARPQYATLKQVMGFPAEKNFHVSFDTLQMMQEIVFDTTQQLKYEDRIEFQKLQTAKDLQQQSMKYYRSQFLPTLSAFYYYNDQYQNNVFSQVLNQAYPYSYIGGTLAFPLFTGFRRVESIQRAKMQGQQLDWAEVGLKSMIYTQYTTALANYKSYLYNLDISRDNVAMAKDVYGVVSLQYKQGIVAYLNVITAETNLISSEINYINALFQLLSSKVDLENAMGNISARYPTSKLSPP